MINKPEQLTRKLKVFLTVLHALVNLDILNSSLRLGVF
jgi:hypothetical protein